MESENLHVEEFLKYYISSKAPPQYAVLINGEWGSGKTWFIEAFIKKHQKVAAKACWGDVFRCIDEKEEIKFLYVSLYGVSSITQIEDKMFQELHPRLASRGVVIGGTVAKGLLKKYVGTELKGDELSQFLENSEGCILVFDDLERCSVNVSEILGYINGFVEHQRQRVIILAHEDQIPDQEEYRKKSEKLIGKKLTISPNLFNALESFIDEIENRELAQFLRRNGDRIAEVYRKAKSANLRSLRQSILEFERMYKILPAEAQKHDLFLNTAMQTFLALMLEIKRGNFSSQDVPKLNQMHSSIIAKRVMGKRHGLKEGGGLEEAKANDAFQEAYERVFGTSINSPVPSLDFLYCFLQFGTVHAHIVDEMMASCRFFQDENTPNWMKLWRIWHLEDGDFALLFPDVFKDFKEYKFTSQGEIKHVAGMLLFFARNGLLDTDLASTLQEVVAVIDEMDKKNLIEEVSWTRGSDPFFNQASKGLQFMELGTEEFNTVVSKINDYQSRKSAERILERTAKLPDLMRTDSKKFIDELTGFSGSQSELYRLPVLKDLRIENFIAAYLDAPAKNRPDIFYALQERYKNIGVNRSLAAELEWLKVLDKELKHMLSKLSQPSKFHANDFLKRAVAPAIASIELLTKQN